MLVICKYFDFADLFLAIMTGLVVGEIIARIFL
jgi:hypothetical protein